MQVFYLVYLNVNVSFIRWEDNIKMDIQEVGWGTWTGLIWLRIGTGGRHL